MVRPSRLLGKAALAVAAGAARATAAAQAAQARKVAAASVADPPKVTETATHRFGPSSADGRNRIQQTRRPVDLAVL